MDHNSMAAQATDWTSYYHRSASGHAQPYFMPLETMLRDGIDKLFAFRTAGVRPKDMLFKWVGEASTPDNYIKIAPNRSAQADFRKIDVKKRYAVLIAATKELGPVAFTEISSFTRYLSALESLIQKIQQRGGRVILVHLPLSGEIKHIVDTRYPRTYYWDRLAKETSAQTLYYEDYPALSRYELPDGYHLDFRQAVPFTQALGKILFQPNR